MDCIEKGKASTIFTLFHENKKESLVFEPKDNLTKEVVNMCANKTRKNSRVKPSFFNILSARIIFAFSRIGLSSICLSFS